MTFARSRLNHDTFASQRPPCPEEVYEGPDCDGWANVYLDGDPNDENFDGGDQGFDNLLDEVVQYANSLATSYAFQSELSETHERDGNLTFLWYVQRYLYLARTEFPETYEYLLSDECWREAILTVWGRAWIYLDATKDLDKLGVYDEEIEPLIADPMLLEEIQRMRDAHGCS
jgi:hypothetical protein